MNNLQEEKTTQDLAQNLKTVTQILKIMSNEHRLLILCVLIDSPLTVNEIQAKVEKMSGSTISQSAISQHLTLLKARNMVLAQKKGQFVEYSILDTKIADLMSTLKSLYCHV